ncbi:MAG: methyltransferase domain-containing protein [Acidobacteriaceae bacterium]|nr:methyltransferase domain-containing protein [Acidobacteriaceae bacterium]
MNIEEWNHRYRSGERAGDASQDPTLLLEETTQSLPPGKALDLACGAGRNAIYLAQRGWEVTAVDGASAAIEMLRSRSNAIRAVVADLQLHEFVIEPDAWDLIMSCYYLQRDLIPQIIVGTKPGGVVLVIAHTPDPGDELNDKRAAPGELRTFFPMNGWEILHHYEGPSRDPAHKRPVAEIVARRLG